jgi:hypothetical protein
MHVVALALSLRRDAWKRDAIMWAAGIIRVFCAGAWKVCERNEKVVYHVGIFG